MESQLNMPNSGQEKNFIYRDADEAVGKFTGHRRLILNGPCPHQNIISAFFNESCTIVC